MTLLSCAWSSGRGVLPILVLCLVVVISGCNRQKPTVDPSLTEDLRLLPAAANIVIRANIGGAKSSAPASKLLTFLLDDDELSSGVQELITACAVDPFSGIDSVLVGYSGIAGMLPQERPFEFLAVIRGRFDRTKLSGCLAEGENGAPTPRFEERGNVVYGGDDRPYMAVLSSSLLLIATRPWIVEAIGRHGRTGAPSVSKALADHIQLCSSSEALCFGAVLSASDNEELSSQVQPYWGARVNSVWGGLNLEQGLALSADLKMKNESDAREALGDLEETFEHSRLLPSFGALDFLGRRVQLTRTAADLKLRLVASLEDADRLAGHLTGDNGCFRTVIQATYTFSPQGAQPGEMQRPTPEKFVIPESLAIVSGRSIEGTAELSFSEGAGSVRKCFYTTATSQERCSLPHEDPEPPRFRLRRCSSGLVSGAQVRATNVRVDVYGGDQGEGTVTVLTPLNCLGS